VTTRRLRTSARGWRPAAARHASIPRAALFALSLSAVALAIAGCGTAGTADGFPSQGNTRVPVVAIENVWGSIARQVGGDGVSVTALITNPEGDPHDYEPTAADARALAKALVVIVNGAGYDPWADRLLAANPVKGRLVIDVGKLAGAKRGDNPHFWYDPVVIAAVTGALGAAYRQVDPAEAQYFTQQAANVASSSFDRYSTLIAEIRDRYAGTPIGASESILVPLARVLGLELLTPGSFLAAMSEGTEPSAADKSSIDLQIRSKLIKVYVYNSQNATPDIERQIAEAKAAGIPVVTVTETIVPADATFQDWQVKQLEALRDALAEATGR
jgi:zinc/manganese transport system substrate-binding protein